MSYQLVMEIGRSRCPQSVSEELELVPEIETRADAVAKFRFAGPDQLHRAILTEKVRGRLTEVFYSMGTGHADFYPHQFKPVLKLVSSTSGRILIADEVGLGKTIEAIYVWKELQARFGCRRLLVVCPSMLQQKWHAELRNRFSIDATIVVKGKTAKSSPVNAKAVQTWLESSKKRGEIAGLSTTLR